jgi:hypothetical protein
MIKNSSQREGFELVDWLIVSYTFNSSILKILTQMNDELHFCSRQLKYKKALQKVLLLAIKARADGETYNLQRIAGSILEPLSFGMCLLQ